MHDANSKDSPYLHKVNLDGDPASPQLPPDMVILLRQTLGDLRYVPDSM